MSLHGGGGDQVVAPAADGGRSQNSRKAVGGAAASPRRIGALGSGIVAQADKVNAAITVTPLVNRVFLDDTTPPLSGVIVMSVYDEAD